MSFLHFLIAACWFFTGLSGIATAGGDPVIIGVLHSEAYPYAAMMRNSHDMALGVINGEGGINGRMLKLVYADDQGKRAEGEKAARKLAKESGAVMLVGGYQSSNTVYMAGTAEKLNIPFLISTAADDRITQKKWKNVYRMNPPAKEYAGGVEYLLMEKIKPATLAIIYENSPYGTGGALQMMWFCRESDIDLLRIIPYHKERSSPEYFDKLIRPLRENQPDIIYMVSYLNDAVLLVKKLRELGIDSLMIGGAGGFTSHRFIAMAGDAADNVLTATLWSPQLPYPGTKEYFDGYVDKYGTPPDYHGAEAFSSLLVAADALRRAKTLNSDGIRAALDTADIITPFGPVSFRSYENFERQNRIPTMVLQISDGNFRTIWPEGVASADFVEPPGRRIPDNK